MKPKNKKHSLIWWKRNYPSMFYWKNEMLVRAVLIDEIIVYYSLN